MKTIAMLWSRSKVQINKSDSLTRITTCCVVAVFTTWLLLYEGSSLGSQGMEGAQQILENAVVAAQNIKDRRDKAEVLHRIALAQASAGDLAASKKTLTQVLTTVTSLKNRNWKDLMLLRVAVAQSIAGDLPLAMDTASKILDLGRKSDALRSIVIEHARHANVQEAIRIAHSNKSESALVVIAYEQAKSKDTKGALNTAAAIEDVDLRTQALAEIAGEQAESGDIEAAVRTVEHARGRSIIADLHYRAMKALARAGDISRAEKIFLKLDGLERNSPPSYRADALIELGEAQVKLGDYKASIETVSKVPEEFMTHALSRVAEAQARLGDIQGALETASSLKSEMQQAHARSRIAKVQAEIGDPIGAIKTFEGLERNSADYIEVLRDIAVSQIKIGDFEGARRTQDMLAADFGTFTQMQAVMAIGVAYAKTGRLQDAMKTVEPIGGLMYRSVVLRDIAMAQAQIGSYAQAWKVASMIEEKEAKGMALHSIGSAQTKAGDVAGAIERSSKQIVPFEKAQALLGVAEGILDQRSSIKK